MDPTLMRLEYVLAPEEFLEGQRVFCSSLGSRWVRFNFKGLIPIGVLLMVEGVVAIIFKVDLFAEILLPVLGAYFIFSRLVLWPRKVRREYDQYPDHAGGRSVQFDEDGVATNTSHGSGNMVWSRFTKFSETETIFVLFAPPRFLFTIPKRAIPAEKIGELRSMLVQKLDNR
jgi:YcxB-like protein